MRKNKSKSRSRSGKNPKDKLIDILTEFLKSHGNESFYPKQIARKLRLSGRKQVDKIMYACHELVDRDLAIEVDGEKYKYKSRLQAVIEGTVDHVNYRFAFVVPDNGDPDIKVSSNNLKSAMDGDRVKVGVYPFSRGKNKEGEVLEIVERKHQELVGLVDQSSNFAFVIPDNKKIYHDIFIPLKELNGAKNKQKVLVTITRFPEENKKAEGKVLEVLGEPGEHQTEMHSIMHEFGLSDVFPPQVIKESEALDEIISKEEVKKRRDFRGIPTFTIDPIDAKDFDDALSFEKLKNGNFQIGVHIADVSHYVREGSALEKEAYHRATSVYLVDRVVPMLPERISNGLCSLRPNEDKLSFSAVFEMNKEGHVLNEWFGRTVIHSQRRFTYEEAQEVIVTNEGDFVEEIVTLNTMAKTIRERRFKAGAINFETPEVRIQLDENNVPIGVATKERFDAHKLVEEFMLTANKHVAQFVAAFKKKFKEEATMVYRVHEEPNAEKVETFSAFAKRFGHAVNTEKLQSSLNALATEIEGKPEEHILQSLAIRAMAKARYTADNLGHYGLGFPHYTHFTSPIRRYPDVMVHRLLQHYLDGGKPADSEEVEERCKHSSEREKNAAQAERTSIKFKQVEYIAKYLGEEFEGVVVGIKEWGFFVEIDNTTCEGLVSTSSLQDDYYEYDEDRLELVGKRNKHVITFGQRVKVKVVKANLFDRTIDLEYIKE